MPTENPGEKSWTYRGFVQWLAANDWPVQCWVDRKVWNWLQNVVAPDVHHGRFIMIADCQVCPKLPVGTPPRPTSLDLSGTPFGEKGPDPPERDVPLTVDQIEEFERRTGGPPENVATVP